VTHAPFAPPMPEAARFTAPDYRGSSRYSYEIQQLSDLARVSARPADEDVQQIRALYDGALSAFDTQVGHFLSRLDEDGLTQRMVVVLGDHGENLFEPGTTTEHGKWFKGGEAANRTVLMFQAPDITPGPRTQLASAIDLMPTLLAHLHLAVPADLDGINLLARPTQPDRTVFAETALWLGGPSSAPEGALTYPALLDLLEVSPDTHAIQLKRRYQDITVTAKLRAARNGPWELVYMPTSGAPRWQLFDLASDPYAEKDVLTARADVAEHLRPRLLQWLKDDPLRWLDADDRVVFRVEQ
jgi:arylsulfatase A-like enzyme